MDRGKTSVLTLTKTLAEIVVTSVRSQAKIEALTAGRTIGKWEGMSY